MTAITVLSATALKHLTYHWFYGLRKTENEEESLWTAVKNFQDNPSVVEDLRRKLDKAEKRWFVIELFSWFFNIGNYRKNSYQLAAYYSNALFEKEQVQMNLNHTKQTNEIWASLKSLRQQTAAIELGHFFNSKKNTSSTLSTTHTNKEYAISSVNSIDKIYPCYSKNAPTWRHTPENTGASGSDIDSDSDSDSDSDANSLSLDEPTSYNYIKQFCLNRLKQLDGFLGFSFLNSTVSEPNSTTGTTFSRLQHALSDKNTVNKPFVSPTFTKLALRNMGVDPDTTKYDSPDDLKRIHRKNLLALHPDKSRDPNSTDALIKATNAYNMAMYNQFPDAHDDEQTREAKRMQYLNEDVLPRIQQEQDEIRRSMDDLTQQRIQLNNRLNDIETSFGSNNQLEL